MSLIVAASPATPPGSGSGSTLILVSENTSSPSYPSALGANSLALGNGATANATNSLALGNQSLARHYGSVVLSSGRFGTTGDCQVGTYLLRTVTATNIPSETFLDGVGGTHRLILPDNSTWMVTISVVGHRVDLSGGHAGYKITGVIKRDSGPGTISVQGSFVKDTIAESDPTWDAIPSVNLTHGSLQILCKGESSKQVRWAVRVDTVEITN